MQIKFPLYLAVFVCLLCGQVSRAQQNPTLFGSQEEAFFPWVSWKGTYLAVYEEGGNFQVWDTATGRALWKCPDLMLSISRDEKTVMVAHSAVYIGPEIHDLEGVTLRLLDARTGRQLRNMKPLQFPKRSTTDELLAYSYSPDGSEFLLATQESLRIYNTSTGALKLTRKWQGLKRGVPPTLARFTHDKKQLVAFDGDLVVLDSHTGAFVRRMRQMGAAGTLERVLVESPDHLNTSPDNFLLVENFEGENDSHVRRLSDGKLLWKATDWPTFSPDGKLAYVPSETGLDVLEAHTGRKLKTLPGPKEYGFEPSPDGNWIYETRDGKIYCWRAR